MVNINISKWAYDTHLKRSIQSLDYSFLEPITHSYLDDILVKNPNKDQIMVISDDPKKILLLDGYRSLSLRCENIQYHTSIIDEILYALNPKYNGRKKTTGSVFCARPGRN